MFGKFFDIAKVDFYFGCDRRHTAGWAQHQIHQQVRWLLLRCHQVVLELTVALSNAKRGNDGVGRSCKYIAVWRLYFGSERVPNLRCHGPLICSGFGRVLVEFNQRPLKTLGQRERDCERFGVV